MHRYEDLSSETYVFGVCVWRLFHLSFRLPAIWRQKFDVKVLDCFISFVSVLEKQQLKQQNPDIVQKAVRVWKKKKKKKFSSVIASPATFSRFVGISGRRGTAQLVVQSWAPLSFIMAKKEGCGQKPVYPPDCSGSLSHMQRSDSFLCPSVDWASGMFPLFTLVK